MPQFLGCFVKCFYFIWSKIIITSSCQKCLGEGPSIVVPAWWAVSTTKVGKGTATGWRVVVNGNVPASSEYRSIKRAAVYGISVRTILPCLGQFHRCPSWLVNQREKKCLWIISILAAGTCWENNKWKGLAMHRLLKKLEFKQTRKYTDSTHNSLTPLAKISNSWKACF